MSKQHEALCDRRDFLSLPISVRLEKKSTIEEDTIRQTASKFQGDWRFTFLNSINEGIWICLALSALFFTRTLTDAFSRPLPAFPFATSAQISLNADNHGAITVSTLNRRIHIGILTPHELVQTCPHHVNIFDAEETKFDIVVKVFVFVTFTSCSIRHSVDLKKIQMLRSHSLYEEKTI